MNSKVQVKGIRDGLLVTLGEGEWEDLHRTFLDHIDQQRDFLKGGRLALNVGVIHLKANDLSLLVEELSERGLILWAVLSDSLQTQQTAHSVGLETQIKKPHFDEEAETSISLLQGGEEAVLVRRTLRSGHSLQYPGHIVIIGDVNPGAEIVAAGDVIVWGQLRGMVHAGAEGDEQAVVCALDLSPTQLRIGSQIAVTPKRRGKPQPELAHLEKGLVVAETWDPKREKL